MTPDSRTTSRGFTWNARACHSTGCSTWNIDGRSVPRHVEFHVKHVGPGRGSLTLPVLPEHHGRVPDAESVPTSDRWTGAHDQQGDEVEGVPSAPGDDTGMPGDAQETDDHDAAPPTPTARPVQMPDEARIEVSGLPGADKLPDLREPAAGASADADAGRRDAAGHPLPRIMAVANQKGGVGKTTTAVNLAAALADAGYRTLVVDLDPQGNASTGLGINIRDLQLSMYDVIIHEASIDDTIEATAMKNLFVAPSSLDLAGAEIELVPAFSRELRLRHALQEVSDDYDYVLIDCPPSLGLLTVNGLAAAAEVLVPIQCEYYALEGLGQLLRNVSLVQRNLNPTLAVSTFVCVMYDARTKLADQVVAEVREHFGEKVCRIVIPRTVRLSEAPSYGQPILAFDPRSRGAIAYRELAREVSGGAATATTA
jgi:chromosome partitioning protein